MTAPDFVLPNDIDALKAMVVAMAEKAALLEERNAHLENVNQGAEERIARLMSIVKMLERARYGNRSERLGKDRLGEEQYALVLDEIETGVAAITAQMDKAMGRSTTKRAPRPRKGFAAHLDRVEVLIEPEDAPGCEGLERILIGEDVSERLDVTPTKFRVIVTRRPKYIYKGRDGVIQAAAPARIIESGIPTEALLAQIAVSKYADGLPLYRQEAIYARDKVAIDRSQMAQWMGKVGFELEPLADYAMARIKQGERIFADETTLPTLAPGSGKAKTAWLWTYVRDDRPFGGSGPPIVVYRFEDSRAGECVARHMEGYSRHPASGWLYRLSPPRPTGACQRRREAGGLLVALRRKFFELHVSDASVVAGQTLAQMASLWALEDAPVARLREHGRRPGETWAAVVSTLFAVWEKGTAKAVAKVEACRGTPLCSDAPCLSGALLVDGRIEIDSNVVERAIRTFGEAGFIVHSIFKCL